MGGGAFITRGLLVTAVPTVTTVQKLKEATWVLKDMQRLVPVRFLCTSWEFLSDKEQMKRLWIPMQRCFFHTLASAFRESWMHHRMKVLGFPHKLFTSRDCICKLCTTGKMYFLGFSSEVGQLLFPEDKQNAPDSKLQFIALQWPITAQRSVF